MVYGIGMGKGQHRVRNRVSDCALEPIRLGFTGGYTGNRPLVESCSRVSVPQEKGDYYL